MRESLISEVEIFSVDVMILMHSKFDLVALLFSEKTEKDGEGNIFLKFLAEVLIKRMHVARL